MKSLRRRKIYAVLTSIVALNLPNNDAPPAEVATVTPADSLSPPKSRVDAPHDKSSSTTNATEMSPTGPNTVLKKIIKSSKTHQKPVYQGFVAALKENFGFVETIDHDKEIFFHYSNVEGGEPSSLELGDEVQYTIASRVGNNGKISAENITLLEKGTLPAAKILDPIYNGIVIRPMRSSNPDQPEYCGLLAIDTDDVERSEQYQFGITGVVNKRELLQKNDSVTFQVDEKGWAVNIVAVRKKLIATVDTVKGHYGFSQLWGRRRQETLLPSVGSEG